jgi:predicted nucleic acid-binding protein
VAVVYLDTSAVGRVLLGEPDAPAILRDLGPFDQRVASRLLRVELRRLALREGRLHDADQVLAGIALLPLDEELLAAAETVTPTTVATLDAIHLVTALRLSGAGRLDAVMTYDVRLADGARQHGLTVLAPA